MEKGSIYSYMYKEFLGNNDLSEDLREMWLVDPSNSKPNQYPEVPRIHYAQYRVCQSALSDGQVPIQICACCRSRHLTDAEAPREDPFGTFGTLGGEFGIVYSPTLSDL
jgi:hypothetical protein